MMKSFYQWCIENEKTDLINRFDEIKNNCTSKDVSFKNNKKFWFKCPCNKHPSELKRISDISNGHIGTSRCIACNSFGQYLINTYGENAIELYWSDKNIINPFEIDRCSHKDIIIKCQKKDYHEDYFLKCNMFVRGDRCPYCHSLKVHKFDSLGYLYPQVFDIWSDKNEKSPYEVTPKSHYKAIWNCENNVHTEYIRSVKESNDANFHCAECVRLRDESFLQEKVRLYLSEHFKYELRHEHNCSIVPITPKSYSGNNTLPFDNEVVDLKLIIEVHGLQHYDKISYSSIWNKKNLTPEQQLHKRKLYDRYKKFIAYCNGYFYLEIPYWTEKDESYKQLIDNKINEIYTLSKSV